MSSHIRKEDLFKNIKKGSRFEKVNDFLLRRKSNFISELNAFLRTYANTEEKYKTISDFIEICENTNEEIYLLKIFSTEPDDYSDDFP